MYGPPYLDASDVPRLLAVNGGAAACCRLLDVSPRTLRRWLARGDVPTMALRLLWYASPEGHHAAELDTRHLLQLVCTERDALREELAQMRAAARDGVRQVARGVAHVPAPPPAPRPLFLAATRATPRRGAAAQQAPTPPAAANAA